MTLAEWLLTLNKLSLNSRYGQYHDIILTMHIIRWICCGVTIGISVSIWIHPDHAVMSVVLLGGMVYQLADFR